MCLKPMPAFEDNRKIIRFAVADLFDQFFIRAVQDVYKAEVMIFPAVPFFCSQAVANQFKRWNGKIAVDVINAFHMAPEEWGSSLSS